MFQLVAIGIMSLFIYACALYTNHPEKHPLDVAAMALQDAIAALFVCAGWLGDFGSVACSVLVQAVPSAEVDRCISLPGDVEVKACVAALVGASPW
mmetsp:Transcript_62846/g.173864  ORF Transcript_62846/g.173864 Transcript_62846/m.173864 type:complete len:96 (+) Transcript_62846:1-288(+)